MTGSGGLPGASASASSGHVTRLLATVTAVGGDAAGRRGTVAGGRLPAGEAPVRAGEAGLLARLTAATASAAALKRAVEELVGCR